MQMGANHANEPDIAEERIVELGLKPLERLRDRAPDSLQRRCFRRKHFWRLSASGQWAPWRKVSL
jgi:hypothetical protein